jgi:hypothetical protein
MIRWMRQSRRQKLLRLSRAALVDPIGVARALPGELRQRHGSDQSYSVEEAWYARLPTGKARSGSQSSR